MAFRKMVKQQYPPRLWALVGYPGSGKSTFATQMQGPILAIDADHRFDEVLDLAADDVYGLSDAPADHVDADRIAALLTANMPGSGVRTIVVDSLTAIITPLVVQAMVDKDAGREKNLSAAFRTKALAMRQLQDAVTRWGCDTLWVYHLNDARDSQGKALVRATVSQTELARLTRSINLQLEIVTNRAGERGIKVVWARRGRSGMTLIDHTGTWAGMPEKIEAAVYDGLSQAEQDRIEGETPATFPNAETAIAWGLEQGAFRALQHSRNVYAKVKREHQPSTTEEMAELWIAEVQARLLAMAGNGEEDIGDPEPESEQPQLPLEPPAEEYATHESELDRFFPRGESKAVAPTAASTCAAQCVAHSPAALLKEMPAAYFRDVRALFEALRAELGSSWSWPVATDVDGWAKAQETALAFVRKNS